MAAVEKSNDARRRTILIITNNSIPKNSNLGMERLKKAGSGARHSQ